MDGEDYSECMGPSQRVLSFPQAPLILKSMFLRRILILGALLVSLAPAQEICSITGTTQNLAAKSACCETACSHCEGKASPGKAKGSPLCMENEHFPAIQSVSLKALPEGETSQPVYGLPTSVSDSAPLLDKARFDDSPPPFFTGRILLSVVLRS